MNNVPTIYCNKKQITVGEEVTLKASISNGTWTILGGDVEYVYPQPQVEDNTEITIKVNDEYESITVVYEGVYNQVRNSTAWIDDDDDGIANRWTGQPYPLQVNSIETGWNFSGRSQRVEGESESSILKQNFPVDVGREYNVGLEYRATKELTLSFAGFTETLPPTDENRIDPIFPIRHGEGLVDFTFADTLDPKSFGSGYFYDGTNTLKIGTYIDMELVDAGTVYVVPTNTSFIGVTIDSGDTKGNYIGNLADLPARIAELRLIDTNVEGDISELMRSYTATDDTGMPTYIEITNSDRVEGSIDNLDFATTPDINFEGCSSIGGNIAYIQIITPINSTISLKGTQVYGEVSTYLEGIPPRWNLNNTKLTKTNIEDSLDNICEFLDSLSASDEYRNGYFLCGTDDMPEIHWDYEYIVDHIEYEYGWVVDVNYLTPPLPHEPRTLPQQNDEFFTTVGVSVSGQYIKYEPAI